MWLKGRGKRGENKKQSSYYVSLQIKMENFNRKANAKETELKYKEHVTD